MAYLDRYLEAIGLLHKLRSEVRGNFPGDWQTKARDCLLGWESKHELCARKIAERIKPLADLYVSGRTRFAGGVERACHLVADDFSQHYNNSPQTAELAKWMPINITIGDVRYK